ncbi:MAG: restriction endonuclease subunit S [Burkholderiales bacterium]|nr:restriction endonuclease subunit S [Burkholderiales bacterium]
MQMTKFKNHQPHGNFKIPIHWKVSRLKHCLNICNGNSISDSKKEKYALNDLESTPYISTKDINVDNSTISENDLLYIPKKLVHYFRLAPKESFLLCIEGGSAGKKIAFLNFDACFVNKLASFTANKTNIITKYYYYYFKSQYVKDQFILSMNGLIGGVSISQIKNFECFIPTTEEQQKIVKFLDKKSLQIDEAIAKTEKMIELLKEHRKITIYNAVTCGINPNIPLKPSGVHWVGNIPTHWQIKRAKFIFNEVDERSITGTEELLSVSHLTGVTPRSEKNVSMFMSESYEGSKLCKPGDLIINIMWAWMGALGVSDQPGIVSPSYGVYRQKINDTFNSYYLEELLKSKNYVDEYNRRSTGLHSSRLRLYSHLFFDMKIGYPGIKEQNKIVEYIQNISQKIEIAIGYKQNEIEKLKEYKATLVDNAVTGKIKV